MNKLQCDSAVSAEKRKGITLWMESQ